MKSEFGPVWDFCYELWWTAKQRVDTNDFSPLYILPSASVNTSSRLVVEK